MSWTIPSALSWPEVLKCRERALQWTPDFSIDASPPALDGSQQFGSSNGGGLWRATLTAVQLRRMEHVKAWLAFELQLRGGATPVDVPLFLTGYQPRPVTGSSVIIQATNGGWSTRAVSGRVALINADNLEPGNHFSDYDATTYGNRMHRIETVSFSSGDLADITFWPPARFAVADNHALEFDNPKCVMRLSRGESADLILNYRKRGDPNPEFVEAV